MGKKLISDTPIKLNIEPISRLVTVEQGDNSMVLTYEQITALKALSEGSIETYISTVKPINKFKLLKNYTILVECNETNSTFYLRADDKRNDIEQLLVLQESNKGCIARNKDIKNK